MTFDASTEDVHSVDDVVDPHREQRRLRNQTMLARAVVVLVLGFLAGAAMASEASRVTAEVESLTFEVYASQYEEHKADLNASILPPAVSFVAAIIMMAFLVVLYEGAVWAVLWLIRKLTGPRKQTAGGLAAN